nr:hypothetical protein [Tanacetum cinerariifolium]
MGMEDLTKDAMWDVLSRLDFKTVSCCKCVCKRWRDLVLDPYFINNLLWSNSKNPSLMIHDTTILQRGRLKWIEQEVEKEQLVDVVTIHDVDLSSRGRMKIQSFKLRSDNWRVLEPNVHFNNIRGYIGDGLFFNGCVHWINDGGHQLFVFELDNETFNLFPSPPFEGEEKQDCQGILGVLKGCLSQGCYYSRDTFTVWVMKQHGIKDSWYKAFTIKETRIACELRWRPLCLLDGLRGGTLIADDGDKLVAYCSRQTHLKLSI